MVRDLQDFVTNHVSQLEALLDQVQCTLDRNAVDINGDGGVGADPFFFQTRFVEDDVDIGNRLDFADDINQRHVVFVQRNLALKVLLDLNLFFALIAIVYAVLAFTLVDVLPHLLVERERMIIAQVMHETTLNVVTDLQPSLLFVALQVFVELVLQSKLPFDHHHNDRRIFRIQLFCFLGNNDCFRISLLLVELVILFDKLDHVLIDADSSLDFLFDLILHAFVLFVQRNVGCLLFDLCSQDAPCAVELFHEWGSRFSR